MSDDYMKFICGLNVVSIWTVIFMISTSTSYIIQEFAYSGEISKHTFVEQQLD